MLDAQDLATTLFVLPADAKLLSVNDLAPRLRERLGPVNGDEVLVTRPGFRVTTRQVPPPLAALLNEFRTASRLTDAVHRFSRAHGQDPIETLDLSFDALLACIGGRILVDASSPDAIATEPSLAAGQNFAGLEVEALVRALDDTEVYRVRMADGTAAALKLARNGKSRDILAHEARLLARMADGGDSPRLLGQGEEQQRRWLALEWCDGVSVLVAAQKARAAKDRMRLLGIVGDLLAAYARLHEAGVLHGDIHPGNILVEDNGKVTLIDFGRASLIGSTAETDLRRAGVPHFHDPQMAQALLAGAVPPAANPPAEQHALAVLAYMLLTGLYVFDPTADQTELLHRIATRPPLPFTARGVAAMPGIERVLHRALAKQPGQRFPSTSAFAGAFRAASQADCAATTRFDDLQPVLEALRSGRASQGVSPLMQAWVSLRGALARADETLLAAADIFVARAEDGWAKMTVAALIARTRCDRLDEQAAIGGFLRSAELARTPESRWRMLLPAAKLLHGADARGLQTEALRDWASRTFQAAWAAPGQPGIHAALALAKSGAISIPDEIRARLDRLESGSTWLWSDAYDMFADPAYAIRASRAAAPRDPLLRGLRHLRLYKLSGAPRWLAAAQRLASTLQPSPSDIAAALLLLELEAPAQSEVAPWHLHRRSGWPG